MKEPELPFSIETEERVKVMEQVRAINTIVKTTPEYSEALLKKLVYTRLIQPTEDKKEEVEQVKSQPDLKNPQPEVEVKKEIEVCDESRELAEQILKEIQIYLEAKREYKEWVTTIKTEVFKPYKAEEL